VSIKTIKRYSVPFKKQVVLEYENGQSLSALAQKYGITGGATIQGWIKKYSRQGFRHNLMRIQSSTEADQVKKLQSKIEDLNEIVAQLSLDNFMLKRCLEVAEDELGHPIEKKSMTLPKKPKKLSKRKKKRS